MKKAIGTDIHGKIKEYEADRHDDNRITVYFEELVELTIPEGVFAVHCQDNQLTELKLPKSLQVLSCFLNHLTELNLPDGMEILYCDPEIIDYDECQIDDVNIFYLK